MIERKTWEEFRNVQLLWWVNRTLHLFGWAIVVVVESDGCISDVYPARVKFRGFEEKHESEGFKILSEYLKNEAAQLAREAKE
jgi:hypothetical protein